MLSGAYDDPGPVLEIVVWHDGADWRAVVGGGEDDGIGLSVGEGTTLDLSSASPTLLCMGFMLRLFTAHEPLTDYRKERVWKTFGAQDLLTYSVNILDEGNLLRWAHMSLR